MLKNNKAFTYLELIIATMILSIAVAGVFAAFLSSARFSGVFRRDIMAAVSAQGALEQARAIYKYNDPNNPANGVDIINGTHPNVSAWPLNNEVNNLQATYSVSDTNLNGTSNPEYIFKRVTVTVNWNERQI